MDDAPRAFTAPWGEDDALIGVRSSALRMGAHVRGGVAGFYAAAVVLWAGAIWLVRPDPLAR